MSAVLADTIQIARKFSVFARVAAKDAWRHQARFLLKFFFCILFCFVFIEVWRLIDREKLVPLPWSIVDVSWYVALAQIMLFLSPRLFLTIEEDVRSGDIACFLCRPMSYFGMRFAEGVGTMLAQAVGYFTAGFVLLRLYIGAWPSDPFSLLPAMALMIGGSCLHILFQITTGLTAFWIQDADALYRIYQKLLIALGGIYMPLALYPEAVQAVSAFMPFASIISTPAGMVLGGGAKALFSALVLQIAWGAIALAMAGAVYRFCLKRIEINGG